MSLHTSIAIVETEERVRTEHRRQRATLYTAVHFGTDFGAQNVMTSPDGAKVQTPNELLKGTETFRARKSKCIYKQRGVTPETFCMKRPSLHIKNMRIKVGTL